MKKSLEDIKRVAEKYEYLDDFRHEDWTAYVYAQRHDWLKELTFLKHKKADPGTYTYEVCRKIAEGCVTRSEFYEKNKTAYRRSLKNGWIDCFSWLRKPLPRMTRGFWTLERTRYALKVCCCFSELMERFPGAKSAAMRYGIYDKLYKTEDYQPVRKTRREECMIAAIGSRDEREMREYFPKEYAFAKKKEWIEEYKLFWEK